MERTMKMTLEEFKKNAEKEDWAPGWDVIDAAFDACYPGQDFQHYATNVANRAIFGGNQYLDGYSIYTSSHGYQHLVTYGMTELYVNEEAFGGKWNGWGYEMTMKLLESDPGNCQWAIHLLANLARYTYQSQRYLEPYQFIANHGDSICVDRSSAITALLTVPDTEIAGLDTIYGRTEFIQLVGITEQELTALKENRDNAVLLVERMKKENPYLVTDLNRTVSYL